MLSSLVLSVYVKFSRTDKMYAFFTRIGAQIWNSIGIAGNAARIGMFTFSAVLLPVDIYTLVTSAMKIKSHGEDEPEEVKRLKDKADELERERNEWLEFLYELNSTHMEEDSVDVTRQCGLTV